MRKLTYENSGATGLESGIRWFSCHFLL